MKNAFLAGTRVYLRPLELTDAPIIAPWFNDPEVAQFTLQYRPISLHGEEEFLRKIAQNETELAVGIVVAETDRLIGVTGLRPDFRCRGAQFGITIGVREAWGQGFGTEATRLIVAHAFETLNLHRVWLHVYEFNPRGLRVYEKVGFRHEGRLREDTYRHGRYWDTIVMGLLRAEWAGVRPECVPKPELGNDKNEK